MSVSFDQLVEGIKAAALERALRAERQVAFLNDRVAALNESIQELLEERNAAEMLLFNIESKLQELHLDLGLDTQQKCHYCGTTHVFRHSYAKFIHVGSELFYTCRDHLDKMYISRPKGE